MLDGGSGSGAGGDGDGDDGVDGYVSDGSPVPNMSTLAMFSCQGKSSQNAPLGYFGVPCVGLLLGMTRFLHGKP